MKIEVNTTSTKQDANEVLGTPEKTIYYLIIGDGEKKVVIHVGQKTFESVRELTTKK